MFNGLLTIIAIPFVIFLLLFLILFTPFDYLRYKKTSYYKNYREKYTLFCGSSSFIKVYENIQKNKLPVEYFRNPAVTTAGCGYFVYKDCLVFVDYDICYDENSEKWIVNIYDDESIFLENAVSADVEDFNNNYNRNIKKSVVLVDEEIYNDIIKCDFNNVDFIAVNNNDYISALETIITTY